VKSAHVLVCILLGIAVVLVPLYTRPGLRLVYNVSDSAPQGIYLVERATDFRVGDYVVARLPYDSAKLAAKRSYLPSSVPVLKQIAAIEGQRVCVRDGWVYIEVTAVARILETDGQRRRMNAWNGCRRLAARELFLLNLSNPASFDSRYFGPLDVSFIRGRATKW
jgi:conjugative transfer signal peptidase TraF